MIAHRRTPTEGLLLDLSELGIASCCEQLQQCTHLEEVALFGNDLAVVPSQLGPTVKSLWLHRNRIMTLSRDLNVWRGQLELLKLSGEHFYG